MPVTVRRRTRVGALAAIGLAVPALLAGCGSSGSTAATGGSASDASIAKAKADIAKVQKAATSYPGITATKHPVDLHGKKIAIVPIADTVDILNGIARNAKVALEHMGATVKICDGKGDPTDVSTCLQQAKADHVDAVATQFVPFGMVPNVYDSLAKDGTTIVLNGDEATPGQTYPKTVSFNSSTDDLDRLAELQGEAAIADFGSDANVINLQQTTTANQIEQGKTTEDTIKKLCPSCPVTTVQFTQSNASQLPSRVSAALVSNPKANVIEAAVDTFVPQIRQGILAAGRTPGVGPGHVEIISNGSDLASLQLVKAGVQAHDMGNSPVFDGYALADAIEKAMSGDKVPAAPPFTRDFVKSNVQDLPLTTAAYNSMAWFGDESFKAEFYKAWGGQ